VPKPIVPSLILALGLAACGSPDGTDEAEPAATETAVAEPPMQAVAKLRTAEGEDAGSATASVEGDAVMIALQVTGLPAGEHGVHVHMVGSCEAPTFESAGSHWNPAGQMHGLEGPEGQHAGDMPNLVVGPDGAGALEYALVGGTWAGLMDADGSAFVVHAMRDDQTTDPSGNSGDRIACGVFTPG
jgi:superoxide dismutase, Cu-Zn family